MDTKICSKCGKELPLSEFYSMCRKKGDSLRADCKSCVIKKNASYYYRDHDASLKRARVNYIKHQRVNLENAKGRYAKLRQAALSAYGHSCACCGEPEPLFLEIDHIENNGAEHRKKIGNSAKSIVEWLAKNNYPNGFQILCANCNQGKKRNGGTCPHKSKKDQ